MIMKLHIFAGKAVRSGVTSAHRELLLLQIPAEQSRGTVVTMAKQVLGSLNQGFSVVLDFPSCKVIGHCSVTY